MRTGPAFCCALILSTLVGSALPAATPAGHWVADEQPGLTLSLEAAADGSLRGQLLEEGEAMTVSAARSGSGFAGALDMDGESLPLALHLEAETLVVEIGADEDVGVLRFTRATRAASAVAPPPGSAETARQVIINGQRLSNAELERIEAAYQIRIPEANYWYDPVLGAWGPRGGPVMGFLQPGLELGGPLAADASGGGTQVFVNGREIHPWDLSALQRITGPIPPGRYFITAQGLAGYEAGPPLWNLMALAAQSGGGGGSSNTWQGRVTGASGFSDGETGAVFLPNGGIVSTGN